MRAKTDEGKRRQDEVRAAAKKAAFRRRPTTRHPITDADAEKAERDWALRMAEAERGPGEGPRGP